MSDVEHESESENEFVEEEETFETTKVSRKVVRTSYKIEEVSKCLLLVFLQRLKLINGRKCCTHACVHNTNYRHKFKDTIIIVNDPM